MRDSRPGWQCRLETAALRPSSALRIGHGSREDLLDAMGIALLARSRELGIQGALDVRVRRP
jgi:hypothetical protein